MRDPQPAGVRRPALLGAEARKIMLGIALITLVLFGQ